MLTQSTSISDAFQPMQMFTHASVDKDVASLKWIMYNTSWGTSMWQWEHTRMTLHNKLYPSTSWKWNHNTHYKCILYVHIIYVCMYVCTRILYSSNTVYTYVHVLYKRDTALNPRQHTLVTHVFHQLTHCSYNCKFLHTKRQLYNSSPHTPFTHFFHFNLTHWFTCSLVTCSSSQWAGRLG